MIITKLYNLDMTINGWLMVINDEIKYVKCSISIKSAIEIFKAIKKNEH